MEKLLERLLKTLEEARRLPLTGKLLLDEGDVRALVEEIRRVWPEELRQAKQVLRDKDRILAEARAEAEGMIREARAYIERMADESTIAREAQGRAEKVLSEAQRTARELRLGARAYADEVLAELENHLGRILEGVRRGRQELGQRRAAGENRSG